MYRIAAAVMICLAMALPLRAEPSENLPRLLRALGLAEMIDVIRAEGLAYGDDLAANIFAAEPDADWRARVSEIYDVTRMGDIALADIGADMSAAQIAELIDFFESGLGVRIVRLEVSARQALLDEAVEEANKARTAQLIREADPRISLLEQFIQVNDLLEANVVSALNSNYAFYVGMVDGGGFAEPVSDEQILSEVWAQESEIRVETGEWLYGYLSLAYSPLSDADLGAYIDISRTPAGQALNTALFGGFNRLFEQIARELGLAAARTMNRQEL